MADGRPETATEEKYATARAMYLEAGLDYGQGVWAELLQAGRRDLTDSCAFDAWVAYQAAFTPDHAARRRKAPCEARYASERPSLRLVIDNTREVRP